MQIRQVILLVIFCAIFANAQDSIIVNDAHWISIGTKDKIYNYNVETPGKVKLSSTKENYVIILNEKSPVLETLRAENDSLKKRYVFDMDVIYNLSNRLNAGEDSLYNQLRISWDVITNLIKRNNFLSDKLFQSTGGKVMDR